MSTKTVNLTEIHRPADLQMRESLRTDHINEMAEALKNGAELPPVRVVQEGKTYWLWDGHHRVAANETAGIRKVEIEVTEEGDRKRARWLAYSANRDNTALKRSLEDRRKAVRSALSDAWDWSDRAIAEHAGVSKDLVSSLRESAGGGKSSKTTTQSRTGKDGKQHPATKKATKKKTKKNGSQAAQPGGGAGSDPGDESEQQLEGALEADPDSLEAVQADLAWLEKQYKWLERQIRDVLGMEKDECHRPYCARYSKLAVLQPVQQARRALTNEQPVGGTPEEPVLKREEVVG